MSAPRPRLTHIIHDDGPGGGPQSVITQLGILTEVYEQSVIHGGAGRIAAYCEKTNTPHFRTGLDRKRTLALGIWQTWRRLRKIRPEVVILHGQWGGFAGALASRFARVPHCVYIARWPAFYSDWDLARCIRNYIVEKVACRFSHKVICLTESSRYQFLLRHLAPEERIGVVPNAIPFNGDPRPERIEALRKQYAFNRYSCNVISVGRLDQQKRNDWLLESWRTVAEVHPNAHLWIVGHGPKDAEWKQLAGELGLESKVTWIEGGEFKGSEFIAAGDIFAHTALFETFGNVIIEAMLASKPIVSTDVDGPRSIISDNIEGLLVPPGDTADFAHALCRLIEQPELCKRLGAAGQISVQNYTPERIAPRLIEAVSARPRPKIAHILHLDGPGGGPPLVVAMLRHLAPMFDQSVIAGGRGAIARYCERYRVPFSEIRPIRPAKWLRAAPALWRALRTLKPDLVILHGQPAGPVGALVAKHLNIPSAYIAEWPAFYTDWDTFRIVRNHLAEWLPCKLAERSLVLSEGNYYQYLIRRLIPEERGVLISNAVSPREVISEAARQRIREKYGWNPNDCHVVSVGRFADQKRVDWLLRSWKHICSVEPRAKLWLVGTVETGPEENALKALAADLQLTNCAFISPRDPGPHFLAAADIVAMTSLYEGHARIPLEAMLNGRPIVASNVDGVSNSFTDGIEGFLVAPSDIERFAARLRELIRNPELRKQMGASGIERAKKYDPEIVYGKLHITLSEILANRP